MESRLKKRIGNLEAKAASATPVGVWEDAATMAESLETLRWQFAACLAESVRRATLPVAEQLALAREDLENFLSSHAENSAQATADGICIDDNWVKLSEKFKRSWIQKLEADAPQTS